MSQESNSAKDPLVSFFGSAILIASSIALIVMLGIVGVAFVNGSGIEEAHAQEVAAAPAPPAPSTTNASEESAEATPATDAAASVAEASEPAADAAEIDPAVMALGRRSYATCAACHGPDGQGLKVGPMLMAPTLTGSPLLVEDPDAAILVILKGIAKENMDYVGAMAPLGAVLDDEKLAAVLTYARNQWGNSAPPITVDQVAEARKKFADVAAPGGVKRGEIPAILEANQ